MSNKARATRRNAERAAAKPTLRLVPAMARKQEKTRTGLEWLLHKGHINEAECRAGIRYGKDYRASLTNGLEPLKSCIGTDVGGGSVAGSTTHHSQAEFSADIAQRLALADAALSFETEMVLACQAIAGRQLTPRQVEPDQRRSERLTQTLRIALRVLVRHYARTT